MTVVNLARCRRCHGEADTHRDRRHRSRPEHHPHVLQDRFRQRQLPARPRQEGQRLPAPGPGQKLWNVGQPLPPTIVYYPLPQPLMMQLPPPPPGYDYVRVDDDVVLMDRNSRLVSQIITNLSRLMN